MSDVAKWLNDNIRYDGEKGEFYWKRRGNGRRSGGISGFVVQSTGYKIIRVRINRKRTCFLAHRLAWFLVSGEWPPEEIDHINRDRADNRIVNLRLATRSQNHCNSKVRKDNRLGVKHVIMIRNGVYRVYVKWSGKNHYGGLHQTIADAVLARDRLVAELHGEFGRVA